MEVGIIGGGVGGLSAAIRLKELGVDVVLVESQEYPSHKVCGEFFSPESLPILEKWGIAPKTRLERARFIQGNTVLEFKLPLSGGSMSRYQFDHQMVQYAKEQGITILTSTSADDITYRKGLYEISLSTGETLKVPQLMLGSGRLLHHFTEQKPFSPAYIGIKGHFEGIELGDCLEMHLFKGGYCGLSSIEEGKTNVACLIKKQAGIHSIEELLKEACLQPLRERLFQGKLLFSMSTRVPEFGMRPYPLLENLYVIGDAAAAIAPIAGGGLCMAVTSGVMAAEYAQKNESRAYRRAWKRRYQSRLRWAGLLHFLMLRPAAASFMLKAGALFSKIPPYLFSLTR